MTGLEQTAPAKEKQPVELPEDEGLYPILGSSSFFQEGCLRATPPVKMRLERSAERDKREIINILSAEYVQSAAEHILNRPPSVRDAEKICKK